MLKNSKEADNAIRQDEGTLSQPVNKGLSETFRKEDLRKTINSKISLNPGSVLSVFYCIRRSPHKRKALSERNMCASVTLSTTAPSPSRTHASAENVIGVDLEKQMEVSSSPLLFSFLYL